MLNREKEKQTLTYHQHHHHHHHHNVRRLRELYLSGNPIGESGTTALAAALKTAPRIQTTTSTMTTGTATATKTKTTTPVIETLDISSCGVGDIGAEAMALAIAGNPKCVNDLNLSNNCISDRGAIALATALKISFQKLKISLDTGRDGGSGSDANSDSDSDANNGGRHCYAIDTLDLSNNVDIGDEGATALFDAFECGAIRYLKLRSCSIRADGVSSLGEVLGRIVSTSAASAAATTTTSTSTSNQRECSIDISGNKIGTRKAKKKAGMSASSMMNSMNSIGQKGFGFLKSGLKDIVDFGGSALESDDEAEEEDSSIKSEDNQEVSNKCGAVLLYDSFIESTHDSEGTKDGNGQHHIVLSLGMRMCNLDDAALDALAALKVQLNDEYSNNISLEIDCEMNQGVDEDSIEALGRQSGSRDDMVLEEMGERHIEALESRRRALEAKEAESRLNGFFGDDDSEESDFFSSNRGASDDYNPYDDYDEY